MVRQRAQRRDPDQEAILRGKDELNTRTTDVIKRLIDVKRKWNGNTEPKFRLTDPMPDDIVGEGGDILRELGDIMTGLRQVDQMQDEYAESRGQRISERMKQMEQVQAEVLRAELTKEASNRLTSRANEIVYECCVHWLASTTIYVTLKTRFSVVTPPFSMRCILLVSCGWMPRDRFSRTTGRTLESF
jgi:hypothetical protein